MTSDITTSHEQLSQLKDAFESEGISYEIGSVRQSTDPTDLLTDRQRRFITEAVEQGYYNSPRETTLTELAAVLDVSKGEQAAHFTALKAVSSSTSSANQPCDSAVVTEDIEGDAEKRHRSIWGFAKRSGVITRSNRLSLE
ncbi:hypothetical protein C2R22_22120 (plasmid) [Salinigranum rubrum]|uniref:HTH bat-type domain-containing protein n=1 Tax=Salinigranum rubrum TaxID=755307 RepID=A0A2I8VQP8_9EURY|nr:hypothetical protein C2R22_22120 [Salinigranum rubrum]